MPKSITVDTVGVCGHAYTFRYSMLSFRGKPASPELWAKVDKTLDRIVVEYQSRNCDNCVAAEELQRCRERVERFSDVVTMQSPPHLVGTVRQLAYAEGVRENFFWSSVSTRVRAVVNAIEDATAGDDLLLYALKDLGHRNGITDLSGHGVDVLDLHKEMQRHTASISYRLQRSSPRETLAMWLVLRSEWKENWRLYDETRPIAWIALRRQYGLDAAPDPRKVEAAKLTAELCFWNDRHAAEAAFHVFSASRSHGRKQAEMLLKLLKNHDGETWQQVMEDAAVWNALTD